MTDELWMVDPADGSLISPYKLHTGATPIAPASPLTASLLSVVVAEDLDGILRGKNDLLVLTRSSMGEEPLVERIHFYEDEVDKGRPIRNLLAPTIHLTEDYPGRRLWIELCVLEIDTDTGERKAAVKAFQGMAATAGAVFPALLPYTMAGAAAAEAIHKLASAIEKDERVVKVPIGLYPGEPSIGRAPLQRGTYVATCQPIDRARYLLDDGGLLRAEADAPPVSYVAFDVQPTVMASPKFVMSQKVATLMTQLSKGNQNSPQSAMDFLNSTLTSYSNFRKLERYIELQGKDKRSPEEEAQLEAIGKIEALEPFLPKA